MLLYLSLVSINFVWCRTLTPGHDAVQKVTLIPRGQARGLTWFIPGDDPTLITKQQIFARIVGALGGRAAEEVIFGDAEVTTGASSDLQQVSSMAKQVSECIYCIWELCQLVAIIVSQTIRASTISLLIIESSQLLLKQTTPWNRW